MIICEREVRGGQQSVCNLGSSEHARVHQVPVYQSAMTTLSDGISVYINVYQLTWALQQR